MRAVSLALVATLLSTLTAAAPADLPGTVLKVGDHPDMEVFAKRDLVERATRSGSLRGQTGLGVRRSTVIHYVSSTASPTCVA